MPTFPAEVEEATKYKYIFPGAVHSSAVKGLHADFSMSQSLMCAEQLISAHMSSPIPPLAHQILCAHEDHGHVAMWASQLSVRMLNMAATVQYLFCKKTLTFLLYL